MALITLQSEQSQQNWVHSTSVLNMQDIFKHANYTLNTSKYANYAVHTTPKTWINAWSSLLTRTEMTAERYWNYCQQHEINALVAAWPCCIPCPHINIANFHINCSQQSSLTLNCDDCQPTPHRSTTDYHTLCCTAHFLCRKSRTVITCKRSKIVMPYECTLTQRMLYSALPFKNTQGTFSVA